MKGHASRNGRPRRVLVIGVAPIVRPEYGGPKRTRAIVETLGRSLEDVRYVAVHAGHRGVPTAQGDIAVSPATRDLIRARHYLADVICGEAIASDPAVKRRIRSLLASFDPEAIVVEQVYPYLGLRSLLRELGLEVPLVYSAHNVEHLMKRAMYKAFGADRRTVDATVARIRDAELEIVARSALVATVSQGDLETLRDMGARRIVLAPNGAAPPRASAGAMWGHRANLTRWGIRRSVVFVSSAHQPNWQGFIDLVGTRLGFLGAGTSVLICGSVGDLVGDRVSPSDVENETFWLRARRIGRLSEDQLAAALLLADVVILPINQGGGSNLKTAEALLSGRRIVGTSFAFRGYEDYRAMAGVRLADDPGAFRIAITMSLDAAPVDRSAAETAALRGLEWDARLAPLVHGVAEI